MKICNGSFIRNFTHVKFAFFAFTMCLLVEQIVEFGHRVARYRHLVARHAVDLLVTNTKDKDQLAMHGMAYALSVELTEVAQLLL